TFFSFYDRAPSSCYTLSLHDALPIFRRAVKHILVTSSTFTAVCLSVRPNSMMTLAAVQSLRCHSLKHRQATSVRSYRRTSSPLQMGRYSCSQTCSSQVCVQQSTPDFPYHVSVVPRRSKR